MRVSHRLSRQLARPVIATLWLTAAVGLGQSGSVTAEKLAPEFEMERLLLQVQEQVTQGNFEAMRASLLEMDALGAELPPDYHYFNALLAKEERRLIEARDSLVRYVNQAGRDAPHYQQALASIAALGKEIELQQKPAPAAQSALPEIESADRTTYETRLRELYLVDSTQVALVEHINALLATHVYVDARVHRLNQREGIQYQVSVSDGQILLQETRYDEAGKAAYSISKTTVFGVNPYLPSGCDAAHYLCWIVHPVNTADRWLVIESDEAALEELHKALAFLIRHLQGKG